MKGSDSILPYAGQLKQFAKDIMRGSMPLWFKATLLLIAGEVTFLLLRGPLGGALGYYLIPLKDFPNATTGFFSVSNGFEMVLTMKSLDMVAAVSLTYLQIGQFLLVNLLILVALAPLKIAVLERFWLTFRQSDQPLPSMLRWYAKPRLFGKAVLMSLLVDLSCRLACLVLLLPSMGLSLWFLGGDNGGLGVLGQILSPLAFMLFFGGLLLAFFLYTVLQPVTYCLAAQPDYSVSMLLRRGLESTKGFRARFLAFRLSFLPWYLFSAFTCGVLDMYLLPYISFSSFSFLQEAAKLRQTAQELQTKLS